MQEAIYPLLMFVLHVLQVPPQLVKHLVKVPVSHLLVQLVLLVLQVPPQHVLQDVKVKDLKLLEKLVLHVLQVPPNVNLKLSPPSAQQEPSYLQLEYVLHVPLPTQTLLPVNQKLLQLLAPMDITSFKLHVKLVKLKKACTTACKTTGYFTSGTGVNSTCAACATGSSACTDAKKATACFTGYYL